MVERTAPAEWPAHVAQRVIGSAFSAAGAQRQHNEDAFGLPPPGAAQARFGTLVALADGVGGLPGGAAASRAAVLWLQALYYAPLGPREPGARLRYCFELVNGLSRLALGDDASASLTTLIAAVAYNDRLWVANVGDSRAYCVRAGEGALQRLTEDHSEVVAVAAQPAAPSAALTRAIGLEALCQVDVYSYTWQPGDRLLLASDGLRALPETELAQLALAGAPTASARALVSAALRLDGSDNATAVVAAFEAAPPQAIHRPAASPPAAARNGPAPAAPSRRVLALVAVLAGLAGLGAGWASAALAWAYLGGPGP